MASGTFTQLYVQAVFAVKGRENLLQLEWRQSVFKYINAIISGKGQKPIIVNGVGDHVHVFMGIRPTACISDLIRDIKNNSSKFINESGFLSNKFRWQKGYGAFSYAHSQVSSVFEYIKNQEAHHQNQTFEVEYRTFLQKFEIDHEPGYLFEFYNG